MRSSSRPGTTLIELIFALAVLAILIGIGYPPLRRALDRMAVRAARDTLLAGVARTRVVAAGRGGAALVLEPASARFWIESARGDTLAAVVDLRDRHGVRLAVDGAAAERVALRYDALGLGRIASRTVRLRRGGEEAGLTIAAYGRARPW